MNCEYFVSLLLVAVVLAFVLIRHRVVKPKLMLKVLLISFAIGVTWDTIAVLRGWWSFKGTLGVCLGVLPLEEYIFFLLVPIGVVAMYELLKSKS